MTEMNKQAQELIEQAYQRGYKAGQAYQRGYKAGQEHAWAMDVKKYIDQGRNEAWEAAGKVWACNHSERRKIFGVNTYSDGATDIYKDFTASDAIDRIRAYEEQKKQEEVEGG